MVTQHSLLFEGLPSEALAQILNGRERQRFPAGTSVLVQGEYSHTMYLIQSGTAEIFLIDPQGEEHLLTRVGPGELLGEMSLLTGYPVSATVRAATDSPLEVLVLDEADFQQIAAVFPRIYRNLAAILSERLARTNRHALRQHDRISLLQDESAPPTLGYALACSVAWHTRAPTLMLVVAPASGWSEELIRLAAQAPAPAPNGLSHHAWMASGHSNRQARAYLMLVEPDGAFAPALLAEMLEELSSRYYHVLVQMPARAPLPVLKARNVRLIGLREQFMQGADQHSGYALRAWADAPKRPGPDQAGILSVPALSPEDESALQQGILPATTPAGRALGWAARDLSKLKVGLALGAGAAKGYAHIGVLRVLERIGLPIDFLAGTSAGGVIAALYALGYHADEAADILDQVGARAFRPTLPTTALLSSAGIRKGMRQVAGHKRIEELDVPLALIAADLITGQEVVFRRGLLWSAVLASMSIPGIYAPQRSDGHTLVDGGLLNPVPSDVVAEMGADRVLAIKLSGWSARPRKWAEAAETTSYGPSVLQTLLRSRELMQSTFSARTAAAATILIEPILEESSKGLRHFNQGRRFIPIGEAAAEAALPRLAAVLPWLRG
jgi:NTE family protein